MPIDINLLRTDAGMSAIKMSIHNAYFFS